MENPNPNLKNEDQDPHLHLETPNPPQDQENLQQIKAQEPEEEEEPDQEPELQQAGMVSAPPSRQNTATHITIPDSEPDPVLQNPPVTSPTSQSLSRRGSFLRKRKRVPVKKKQALAKKLEFLSKIFKPIPFSPNRSVDFSTHEKLLKRLGLWDFVHIELDRVIRTDLIMEFIVSYNHQTRCGYVNDNRIQLNRPNLARAMKLPVKKDKMNVVEGEGDEEVVSDEAKAFVESLVSNWVLLHDDMWILPNEVVNWTRVIREGHPEKVDWASLMWFMVEKEVLQGQNLSHCYYASHLQLILKLQRGFLFSTEPVADTTMEEDDDIAEIKVCDHDNVIEIINKRGPLEIVDKCHDKVETGGSDDVSTVGDEVKMEPCGGDLKMGGSDDVSIVKDEVKGGSDDVSIVKDEVKMEPHGGDLKMDGSINVKIGNDNVKMGLDIADVKIGEDDLKMRLGIANVKISDDDVKMGLGVANMTIGDNDLKMRLDVADVNIDSSADVKIGGSDDVNVGGSDDVKVSFSSDVKIGDADATTGLDGGDVNLSDDDVKMGLDGGEFKIASSDDGDNVKFAGYDVIMGTIDGGDVKGGDNDVMQGTKGCDLTVEEEGSDMLIRNSVDYTNEFAEPNVELNLGQNNFIKEELVQDDSMDFEQCEAQEVHQWLLNNNNNMNGHILQPCSQSRHVVCDDVEKQQEDVEEDQVLGFSLIPKCRNADSISSENLIEELDDHSLMEQLTSRAEPIPALSGPSGFGNISRREISHDHDQGNHKRLRMDEQWDDDRLPEPDACMEIAERWMAKSRLSYQRQEEAHRNTAAHQEYLMNVIHQRDAMIEHLNKVQFEEQQRKQIEIYRLNRELFSMTDLLQSYRKALKETRRSFAEYRALCQYPEQPLYKDVEGGGGLVVTCAELERERVKQEREELAKRNAIEVMFKEFELEWTGKFERYSNDANMINSNLLEAEKNVQILKEIRSTRGS